MPTGYNKEGVRGGAREYPGGVRKQQYQQQQQGDGDGCAGVERPFPGGSPATRTGGGGLGAATAMVGAASVACDSRGGPRPWQCSSSVPQRLATTAAPPAPGGIACVAEETTTTREGLYSEAYRHRYAGSDARSGAGGGRGTVSGGRGGRGGDDGSPPQNDGTDGGHSALKFWAGLERPRSQNSPPPSDPRREARSSRVADRRKSASGDEWGSGGGGDRGSAPCYGGDDFGAPAAAAAWRATGTGTDDTTMSPRRDWRGLSGEAEETEPDTEARSTSRPAVARGFGTRSGPNERGGGAIGAAWRSGSRLAGAAAAGPRPVARVGRSLAGGGSFDC